MNSTKGVRGRLGVLILSVLAIQACTDSPSSSGMAAAVASGGPLAPSATVNTAVRPVVLVEDERGRPVAGARVSFEVTAGGGSMATSVVETDGAGRAEAQWTLGRTAGDNTVTARVGAGRAVTFNVTGVPGPPAVLRVVTAAPEVAPVSGAVGIRPAVRVSDAYDNAIAGVTVEFRATDGGGSVEGGLVVTDASGIAVVGGWTVGSQQGENALVATLPSVPELAAVRFTTRAVLVSGEWLHLVKFAGDATTCPANTAGCSFTVRVSDVSGSPVAGESVLWEGPGGASATTVTNAHGLSTAPNLGPRTVGEYTQTARLLVPSDDATFRYRVVPGGGFHIDLRFVTDASPAVRAAFESARTRWQQVITGDIADFPLTGTNQVAANSCGITHPAVNEVVDDLLIFVEIVPIDGPGKILGSAGPCLIRGASGLPILGVVKLDKDDLDLMAGNGMLGDVILHEIGHVLGIGTLWQRFSLLRGAGTSDPYYTGERAQSGFVLGGGTIRNGVPVENTGGEGTREGHWRETTLGNELMTGFINRGANPLSVITVGSLLDMGYQVNFGAADGYALPGPMSGYSFGAEKHELHEVPLPAPRRLW
jgi:hypothetical protein